MYTQYSASLRSHLYNEAPNEALAALMPSRSDKWNNLDLVWIRDYFNFRSGSIVHETLIIKFWWVHLACRCVVLSIINKVIHWLTSHFIAAFCFHSFRNSH